MVGVLFFITKFTVDGSNGLTFALTFFKILIVKIKTI